MMRILFQTRFSDRYEVALVLSFSFCPLECSIFMIDSFHNIWEASYVTHDQFSALSERLVRFGYLELPDMVFDLVDRGEVYPE